MISHFTGRAVKFLLLSTIATLLLAGFAMAAERPVAVGVGATTGSSLRMRAAATTDSDIITTLNKEVAVAILDDSNADWFHISYDGKSGYVSTDYLVMDQDNRFETYGRTNANGVCVRSGASIESEILGTVGKDTYVTVHGFENGWYDVTSEYGTKGYIRSDFLDLTETDGSASSAASGLVDVAKRYLGTRYSYGGASPSGFDCSGFTMFLYRQLGISLPHTATGQWQSGVGTKVYSASEMVPGDLVFFNDPSRNNGKACSHVGLYMGNKQFIHASSSRSGGVIISSLNEDYYNRFFKGGLHL